MSKQEQKNVEVKEVVTPEATATARKSFESAVIYLLTKEPFYASLLLQVKREFSTRVPTAGIYITNAIHLIINPNFFNKFEMKSQIAIIKHELFHLILNHCSRWKDFDKQLFNQAADIALNQYITDFPQTVERNGEDVDLCTIENFNKKGFKLPNKETSEVYYKILDEKLPKMPMGGEGQGLDTIDDHSIWEQGYTNKTITENITKNAVNKAYKEALSRNAGNIPSEIERIVQEINKPTIDWKGTLRRFVSNSAETFVVETRKRRNRRFGIYYPGSRVESKLNVVEINDTSGSMSEEQLAEIYEELRAMSKNDVTITSIDCDTKIHEIRKFDPMVKPKFLGGGGTDMTEALQEAEKMNPDCVIYFGDGYIPNPIHINIPTLWVINGGNKSFTPPYGQVLYME